MVDFDFGILAIVAVDSIDLKVAAACLDSNWVEVLEENIGLD
jgi:hypothetical protein